VNATTVAAAQIASKKISTSVEVKITLDISAMDTEQKTAVGYGVAYGIHDAACKGVQPMWDTLVNCMLGNSKIEGISFGMAMAIDSQLVTEQPGCNSASDCYGGEARRLAAVELANKGDFDVSIAGPALADTTTDYVAQAKTAIETARTSGALSASNVQASLVSAMNRTAVTSKVSGDTLAAVKAAAQAAVATVSAPVEVIVTVAPATQAPAVGTGAVAGTSSAYTTGVASALAVVFGALLF
jgi:hypothetical protein